MRRDPLKARRLVTGPLIAHASSQVEDHALTSISPARILPARPGTFRPSRMPPPLLTEAHPPLPLDELVDGIRSFDGARSPAQAEFVARLVDAHPVLSVDWGPQSLYRRARRIDSDGQIRSVRDVIWPPEPSAGRLNPKGQPIMYVSYQRETALTETGVGAGRVAVATFKIRQERSCRIAPIGELYQIQRTGRGRLIHNAEFMLGMMNACPLEQARSLVMTDAFLFHQLCNQSDDYARSHLVADAIFSSGEAIDAIGYPSMRSVGGLNFAVRTDRFWQDWGLVAVSLENADHLGFGYYKSCNRRCVNGVTNAGDFVWCDESHEDGELILGPEWHPPNT